MDCGTEPNPARPRAVTAAAAALKRGDLVVLPTESAYGVAAEPFSLRGVTKLRAAKGRGPALPIPVLVGSPRMAEGLVLGLRGPARALLEAFWPGPLTLVARQQPSLAWDLAGADGTVSVRMPLHPVMLDVIAATGPLAVTGAQRAGSVPPRTCAQAQEELGDAVAIYLDAGPTLVQELSTVVDVTDEVPVVLRPGAYPLHTLREVAPDLTWSSDLGPEPDQPGDADQPGDGEDRA
jgi:tRNA threonylcarbamoyl adenosine modification protein (Sua5/YciO/YrdC/YwlC family)